MKAILIATDGAVEARGRRGGLDLAEDTGAEVVFLAVRRPPVPVFGDPYWQQSITNRLARLRPALNEATAEAEARGIEADYDLLEETPPRSCAHARDVDLIVLGSRGLGTVSRRSSEASRSAFCTRRIDRCSSSTERSGPAQDLTRCRRAA